MKSISVRTFINRVLDWKFFLACNVMIFVLKVAFSVKSGFKAEHFEDWSIAENITYYGKYAMDMKFGSSAYKLPIYPLFLSAYMKIFGTGTAAVWIIITQHLFYFLIPVLLIRIFQNFRSKEAGFLAAYFFIFSPSYFYYSNIMEATNIFLPLFIGWIYMYSLIWKKGVSNGVLIIFSMLTAVVALTQVVAVPVMALLGVVLLISRKISLPKVMAVVSLSALCYAPWVIRNYLTFDIVILSKSPVWQNMYLGYIPDHQILDYSFVSEKHKEETFARISRHNEFEDEGIYKGEVENIIRKDHWAPVKKALNNIISLWFVPKKYFDDHSLSVVVGRKLYVMILNIALLISLVYFFRKSRMLFFVLVLVFAGFTVPYLIGHAANIRFKLDFEWIQASVIALWVALNFLKVNTNKIS
ncbi:glycosyltransferase family 39 protein [uncultured Chryseobacterium sp.]|uniref:glycosyltransferase family 39 protein n=1 Tax=uncultured Chryseobacterium sp. TaxID=259322 RepID=UPI0025E030B0|nr:glycosyltransferase family 39 protein [uncultured Chryseobacterium sp.]